MADSRPPVRTTSAASIAMPVPAAAEGFKIARRIAQGIPGTELLPILAAQPAETIQSGIILK